MSSISTNSIVKILLIFQLEKECDGAILVFDITPTTYDEYSKLVACNQRYSRQQGGYKDVFIEGLPEQYEAFKIIDSTGGPDLPNITGDYTIVVTGYA